jgi:hypothetical protein
MSQIVSIESDDISLYDIALTSPGEYSNTRRTMVSALSYTLPVVKNVRTINTSKISTSEYYSQRSKNVKSRYKDHLYPIAVRYISKDNQFVIERPPFELEIDFRLGSANSHASKISSTKIWIPWTIMIVKLNSLTSADFSSVKLFFNDGPISSIDDIVLPPWLPNSYNNGSICFSNSLNDFNSVLDVDQIVDGDLAYIYNYIFNNYMMGGWNTDLHPHFNYLYVDQYSIVADQVPTIMKYNYPSKESIKQIVSNYSDQEDAKYVKKCLSSNQTVYSYRNPTNLYTKHFANLSSFSLEETLSLITEVKNIKAKQLNNKYKLSTIINGNVNHYGHSSNNFITDFSTNVISNPSFAQTYEYTVTDNIVYFDTTNFDVNVDNGFNNTDLNINNYYFSDSLVRYIGSKNMSKLEQVLIKMNKLNISNKIIICSFQKDGTFLISLAEDEVDLRSLLQPHKDDLSALIESKTDLENNSRLHFNNLLSNITKGQFHNV